MEKKCFKCGEVKNLDRFYKHSQMADGHFGKCKDCAKKDVREREVEMYKDVDWHIKERKRGR